MSLKTIGDLKGLILENEGILTIGALEFKYSNGSDIDIKFDGELIQWYHAKNDNDTLLITEGMYSFTNSARLIRAEFKEKKDKFDEIQKENIRLKQENTDLIKRDEINSEQKGLIKAYENLLLNRKVTLEN